MTTGELISRLDGFVTYLRGPILADFAAVGLDLTALTAERIQTEGKKADGGALKAYTAKYLEFKKNPKKFKRGRDLGLGSSRFTGKTDYSLTGEFWGDVKLISQEYSGELHVTIGPTKQINIDKYKSLTKRDGQEPLHPSSDEIQRAVENMEARVLAKL